MHRRGQCSHQDMRGIFKRCLTPSKLHKSRSLEGSENTSLSSVWLLMTSSGLKGKESSICAAPQSTISCPDFMPNPEFTCDTAFLVLSWLGFLSLTPPLLIFGSWLVLGWESPLCSLKSDQLSWCFPAAVLEFNPSSSDYENLMEHIWRIWCHRRGRWW